MPTLTLDYFSTQAADYAAYRPHDPPELFASRAALAPARDLAWDCATGSGQAAVGLADHFTLRSRSVPSWVRSGDHLRREEECAGHLWFVRGARRGHLLPRINASISAISRGAVLIRSSPCAVMT